MSEFKRALTVTFSAAAIGVGSFAAAQEMSENYERAVSDCVERTGKDRDECKIGGEAGSDYSGVVMMVGGISLLAAAGGAYRTFDAIDEPATSPQAPTETPE